MAIITPRHPSGTMELLPNEQIAFQKMLDTIRAGYEKFGFLPIETPSFERREILLTKSGGETEKQVYFIQSTGALEQNKDPDMALHFDLTVPLARYVAQRENDLNFPFRRYQIQRVWRGERAQKGRYREFYQCDIDVIGKEKLPLHFDAEMPAIIYGIFKELNVGPFQIQFNNRKLLRGLFTSVGLGNAQTQEATLREIDKLDKIGQEAVIENLQEKVGLSKDLAQHLLNLTGLKGSNQEILDHLSTLDVENDDFAQGLDELQFIIKTLQSLGVPEENACLNLAIARGLDYYTGTVYETILQDHPSLGSVCSGGRYENLAGHYTKSKLPGVGISIGASRLFYALQQANLIDCTQTVSNAMIAQMDDAYQNDCLKLATTLREAGLNIEIYPEKVKLKKQLSYANKANIPYVLMIGESEFEAESVTVKNLQEGTQELVKISQVVDYLIS